MRTNVVTVVEVSFGQCAMFNEYGGG
jgi:hypothetical protein